MSFQFSSQFVCVQYEVVYCVEQSAARYVFSVEAKPVCGHVKRLTVCLSRTPLVCAISS